MRRPITGGSRASLSQRTGLCGLIGALALIAAGPSAGLAQDRSINGWGNNLDQPAWGGAGIQLKRHGPAMYDDGMNQPAGSARPNPRTISNTVFAQSGSVPNTYGLSSMVFQWGQFIDHDLDLAPEQSPAEPMSIQIPAGDPWFDPGWTGTQSIPMSRSKYDGLTGTDPMNPRQQMNVITSWIDGSNVYGSDSDRAGWLRTQSDGKLKTSAGNMLPYNDGTMSNGGGMGANLFVGGDIRANEQVGLTAMHTLFVREHNYWADQIKLENPGWDDDEIYQRARKMVGAEIQSITYNEFLPALLGEGALSDYSGYNDGIDGSIANEFATAFYRVGHTMLPDELLRLDDDGHVIPEGNLELKNAFFSPQRITDEGGIDPLLKGLASQLQQQVDAQVVDGVRNFLFGAPGEGGFDLVSLNIMRGREHGLADYNTMRSMFGLEPAGSFDDITSNGDLADLLEFLYGDVSDVDAWVGALAEDHAPGAAVGELVLASLADQFGRLRDGDRFWFEYDSALSADEIDLLSNTTLADIILRNTGITTLQSNVFFVPEPATLLLLSLAGVMMTRRRCAYFGKP